MTTINTYLTFKGNCEEAFLFYKKTFGGEFTHIGRFKEMPADDPDCQVEEEDHDKIMHVSLPIGNTVLMGSDAVGAWGKAVIIGSNFSVSIHTDSIEEADRLFNILATNGKEVLPMNQTFWGSYFGMLTDQFGIQWMVSFDTGKTGAKN
ncbi:MAG: VOC family protein [Flavobacteriaceae bacterium]|nr:MAG: VOC family protein [Flavobacteriaceae bacterium]